MPDAAQIAGRSGIPVEKVKELLELLPEVCSLDAPTGDDQDSTVGLLLEDVHAPQPQEELVRRELKNTMDVLLGMLPERQRQIRFA